MKNIILFSLLFFSVSLSAWSQTEHYGVYAIKFASMAHPSPISNWADKGPGKDSVNIDFMIWLIKGNNGKNILVDAGFLKDIEAAKYFDITHYGRPDSMLAKLALKAGDITDIILSHPHWDHIDGIGLFPNAHIWIQKEDFNYFVGGAWQKDGRNGGFDKRDVRRLIDLNLAGKLTLVDGDDKEIIPGIKVYTGSRHTFNSQYVFVETGINKVILASDNIWIYYNLEHLRPAASGGTSDTTAYVKSMIRMKTLVSDSKYIIPGHDSKIFSLFPAVTEGVVKIE
ncbi:MAG: N-acyl homoserine lactonase family protein [Bacteroidota bacterium]|nr:N-acyl homoserine lactonase family protein [Bacteroidota bacterium]